LSRFDRGGGWARRSIDSLEVGILSPYGCSIHTRGSQDDAIRHWQAALDTGDTGNFCPCRGQEGWSGRPDVWRGGPESFPGAIAQEGHDILTVIAYPVIQTTSCPADPYDETICPGLPTGHFLNKLVNQQIFPVRNEPTWLQSWSLPQEKSIDLPDPHQPDPYQVVSITEDPSGAGEKFQGVFLEIGEP